MTLQSSESMTVHNAPESVHGQEELRDFRGLFFNQQLESLRDKPTNAERLGEVPLPTYVDARNKVNRWAQSWEDKYVEQYVGGLYPIYDFGTYKDSDEGKREKFDQAAERAGKVFGTLKLPEGPLTSELPFLASLKEAYQRTEDPALKADMRRVFNLMGFHLFFFDQSQTLIDYLVESEQTPEDYLIVMTKLLADERQAYENSQPVLQKVAEYRQKFAQYCDSVGLYFPLPKDEEIIYTKQTGAFNPAGPIYEMDYPRHGFRAIVKSVDEVNIDPAYQTFVIREPVISDETTEESLERDALAHFKSIVHESVHFNKKQEEAIEEGSVEEATNEMMTDFTNMTLLTSAGIGEGYQENGIIPKDYSNKVGYWQLVRTAFRLQEAGLIKREEFVQYGLRQDPKGFSQLLDQRLAALTPEIRAQLVEALDHHFSIGPNQYEQLLQKQQLTTNDLIKGVLDFGKDVGPTLSNMPGALMYTLHNSIPEAGGKSSAEFLDWWDAQDRSFRHAELRKVIERIQS